MQLIPNCQAKEIRWTKTKMWAVSYIIHIYFAYHLYIVIPILNTKFWN